MPGIAPQSQGLGTQAPKPCTVIPAPAWAMMIFTSPRVSLSQLHHVATSAFETIAATLHGPFCLRKPAAFTTMLQNVCHPRASEERPRLHSVSSEIGSFRRRRGEFV